MFMTRFLVPFCVYQASWPASLEGVSPVSDSHLSIDVLQLQICTIILGFTGFWGSELRSSQPLSLFFVLFCLLFFVLFCFVFWHWPHMLLHGRLDYIPLMCSLGNRHLSWFCFGLVMNHVLWAFMCGLCAVWTHFHLLLMAVRFFH